MTAVDLNLDFEVLAKLKRFRTTQVLTVENEDQIKARFIILDPSENLRGRWEVSQDIWKPVHVDYLIAIWRGQLKDLHVKFSELELPIERSNANAKRNQLLVRILQLLKLFLNNIVWLQGVKEIRSADLTLYKMIKVVNVSYLARDGECLLIHGPHDIIEIDCIIWKVFFIREVMFWKYQMRNQHHPGSSFACLAMNSNSCIFF